jgi:hypothetical protein
MATTFDPTTAYRSDWQFHDAVEDATLVRRNANGQEIFSRPVKIAVYGVMRPDYQQYGAGANLSPNTPVAALWNLLDSEGSAELDPPQIDDAILRLSNTTELVVTSVDDALIGPWMLSLMEARVNE